MVIRKLGIIVPLWMSLVLIPTENLLAQPPQVEENTVSEGKETEIEKLPEIVVDSEVYDCGEIWSGERISHAFVLENKGDGDFEIRRVSPG